MINENIDIIGYPRLVRLNPNIPWKTRGNGAISLQIGKGKGKKIKIGKIDNREILSYTKSSYKNYYKTKIDKIKKIIEKIIEIDSEIKEKNTNPGFVLLEDQISIDLYERAVREVIDLEEVVNILESYKASFKGYKNCRGLIGAASSTSWISRRDKTYELITYREKDKWKTKRIVDDQSVKRMDKIVLSTFDNYDFKNKHNRITPNSPCPILYGIRGNNTTDLINACSLIESERVDRWLIFETNQGTDDHLQYKKIVNIQPFQSVIVKGKILQDPYTIKGGHVIFKIGDNSNKTIDCAAYEPTKEFRKIIRKLIMGDIVEVYGGIREKPHTINIEKINIKFLEMQYEKVENPMCPNCKKHMKSKGMNQAYKCKKCGIKSKKIVLIEKKRSINTGFYEVPVCARRHLSKPLKRML